MSREININRQLLGLEDILFGTGIVTQIRAGQTVNITRINAGNLPFDETQSLLQWAQSVNLEQLGSMITELQAIYDNLASISNIDDNLSLLNNIISNITVLQELHTNLSILQNVNSNITIITDVNTNLDILTSIYNNLSTLVNIHTNLSSLLAIDTNMQQLLAIDTNLPELLSINTNIVPNITEILDVNNKAEQVALDKQVVESLASQVTMDKQDINTMKLAVETIYDTFDDRFLGAKDIDPLVDNDGNALLDGALYFNTLSNALKVYVLDITTWVTIPQIYLSSLLDVQLTSITTNSILTWNGAKWVNTTTPVFDSIKLTGTNYGVMSWNSDEQVPSITLNSDVDIDLGESLILVKNTTGSTILDGRVVMAIGSNGNSGNILVSLHSGLKADAKRTSGIATQTILNDSSGFVTKEGKVKGINTTGSIYGETWGDGDILYVKANGALTKVEPLDSQLKMPIAFVIHAHTHGTLYVRTTGIDENHDRDLISTKLDTSEYTATDILTKLKTVDGSGSGLEAETVTNGVYTTGDQDIYGIKTFSSSPIVPTPTTGTQAVNKDYVDNVAKWNTETEYLAGASVQHSGSVWLCKTTNTNSEPTDLNANWEKVAINKDLTVTVDTLADLRSISYPANTVWANGYHTKNDGAFGSHIFRLKGVKTTETDNGGTVIIASIGGVDYVYELQYDGAVNVKWFGAKGDGVTDDTVAIQSAINEIGNTVFEDNKTYSINVTQGLNISSNKDIDFRGSTLKAIATDTEDITALINIFEKDNICIQNGILVGERYTHIGTIGEYGMGIDCRSSSNVYLKNITVKDCWGDGVYFGTNNDIDRVGNNNIKLERVILENNRRNNMSIIALTKGSFVDCVFENANGVSPQAGVDLEPNNVAEIISDLLFEKCTFKNNAEGGLISAGPITDSKNIIIKNCIFLSNKYNIVSQITNTKVIECHVDGSSTTVNYFGGITLRDGEIRNNKITNMARAGIGIFGDELDKGFVLISNNVIENTEASLYIQSKHDIEFTGNSCVAKNHIIRQARVVSSLKIINNICSLSLYNSSYYHFRLTEPSEKEVLIKDNIFLSINGVNNTQNSLSLNNLTTYSIYGNNWKGWGNAIPISGGINNYGYGNMDTDGVWKTTAL